MPALARRDDEEERVVLQSDTPYREVAAAVDIEQMSATIRDLASYGSRVTLYPGYERAAEYVEARFRELGLEDVAEEPFAVAVPMVEPDAAGRAASVTVDGTRDVHEILPLWPNLVRTCQTPPSGLSGRLIYAHQGRLDEFNGLDVVDSIVLLDFNCGSEWFNGPLLGAKAVLFIEPESTIRGEAEPKFLSIPVNMPRFWVPRRTADTLLAELKISADVRVTLHCDMKWKKGQAKNIVGRITGTDERLKRQQVVIQAYYDSMSVVPTLAPGAESACSMATLFQAIKAFKKHPPKRTVLFLATAGHFQALAGTKNFIDRHLRGAKAEKRVARMFGLVNDAGRELSDAAERVWEEEEQPTYVDEDEEEEPKSPDEIATDQLKALSRIRRALSHVGKSLRKLGKTIDKAHGEPNPNEGKPEELWLDYRERRERARLIQLFDARLPEMRAALEETDRISREAMKTSPDADLATKQAALDRVKAQVEKLGDAMDFSEEGLTLWFSIDLSSHNDVFGIFYKGFFYDYSENIQWKFSDIGKKAREYSSLIDSALTVQDVTQVSLAGDVAVQARSATRLVDGINAIQGKSWRTYMAGKLALSNEVATLAGVPGLGFATVDDSRPLVDTPLDTPAAVDVEQLHKQAEFLICLLCDLINFDDPREKDLYDLRLDNNFVEVNGRCVEFIREQSLFPDDPVIGAVAVARTGTKTAMGVRGEVFDVVEIPEVDEGVKEPAKHARISLLGLPNLRARGGQFQIEGYKLNVDTGAVEMAPDYGVTGAEQYPIKLSMDMAIKPVTVVLFRCTPMVVYDMVDQRFFQLLSQIYVYDASTDAAPYEHGYCLPLPPQQWASYYEPVAVVFAPRGTYVKVCMGASVLGLRFVLLNPQPDNPEGRGYLIDAMPAVHSTPFRVAEDMWEIDEGRIKDLRKYGIENQRINEAHTAAKEYLEEAREAQRAKRYDKFMVAARSAWSYESRAYPDVRTTANDVIRGVLFYLFLLLPFSYFAERLFIAAREIKYQIVGSFAIFIGIFGLLTQVHPAFQITFTPAIILLAFIILALTAIVITIIIRKFEEQMKQVRYEQTGVHTADVGRLSASTAAFNLGISNLRRRKTRTALTSATLILLTFTVLSFTSVVQGVRVNKIPLPKAAPYDGIMIRDKTWGALGEPTTRVIKNEFGKEHPVASRSWYLSAGVGQQSFVNVSRGDKGYAATAMVGLEPEEDAITGIGKCLRAGHWFTPEDTRGAIVPAGMADQLEIDPKELGNVFVYVFGVELPVIGILDSSKMKRLIDLDGEQLTPVDYLLMQEQQAQQQASGREVSEDELREYIHVAPDSVLFVPYQFLITMGGNLRSIAIGYDDPNKVNPDLDSLMRRIELNLYAGIQGKTYLASAVGSTGVTGGRDVTITILIAALIVLNTMLGSVYERVKEIGIYSSLGLAPTHIASLFIAEACVYAVLGAIAGYMLGQTASKLIVVAQWGFLEGLNLNYSSIAAVMSTLIVMATVLLSTLYPARKASSIAVPGVERRWRLPEPEDDQIKMILPFTVTGDQAMGVNMFLHEWLDAHADYSLGHFSTGDIKMREAEAPDGRHGYELDLMVWLAPYDLGVSERLVLHTVPDPEEEETYQISCTIRRESGDEASWTRVTRNFINMVRKQYLLWRTFPVGLKAEYGQKGTAFLGQEPAALQDQEELEAPAAGAEPAPAK